MAIKEDYIDGDGITPALKNIVGNALNEKSIPIGAIIAWAKTLTNVPVLPDGFIECDGSTISDADSPMNGQAVPDLISSSNRFLRGNTTSGGTGGNLTHTHGEQTQSGAGSVSATVNSARSNEPPYYDVVWIIRIK